MRIGTRGKAVVQPASLPSSRTRNVGKATWFSGVSPGVLGVWALQASGLLFQFCFWVSSRRVVLALVGRLSSSLRVCFKKEATTQGTDPKDRVFPTGRPRAERALRGGRERRGDDPRTGLLTGTPYDLLGRGIGCWVTYSLFPIFRSLRRHGYPSVAAAAPLFHSSFLSRVVFASGPQEWTQLLQ